MPSLYKIESTSTGCVRLSLLNICSVCDIEQSWLIAEEVVEEDVEDIEEEVEDIEEVEDTEEEVEVGTEEEVEVDIILQG